jgi:hypothetical protein
MGNHKLSNDTTLTPCYLSLDSPFKQRIVSLSRKVKFSIDLCQKIDCVIVKTAPL